MVEQDRIAAQIAAESRLNRFAYDLRRMPDGAYRAHFYVDVDEYLAIAERAQFKPPVDCEVVYVMDDAAEADGLDDAA